MLLCANACSVEMWGKLVFASTAKSWIKVFHFIIDGVLPLTDLFLECFNGIYGLGVWLNITCSELRTQKQMCKNSNCLLPAPFVVFSKRVYGQSSFWHIHFPTISWSQIWGTGPEHIAALTMMASSSQCHCCLPYSPATSLFGDGQISVPPLFVYLWPEAGFLTSIYKQINRLVHEWCLAVELITYVGKH